MNQYLEILLSKKVILKSRFLIFFLSCDSNQLFYSRRKKEFNNSIFKNIADKFSSNDNGELKNQVENDQITNIMDQLDLREDSTNDENFKINVFLEDLSSSTKGNKKPLSKANEIVGDLCSLMKKVAEKTKELAEIFSTVSGNYWQFERNKTKEIESISPKIGKICDELKTGFYGLSNITENKISQLNKLIKPLFTLLKSGNKKDTDVKKNQI